MGLRPTSSASTATRPVKTRAPDVRPDGVTDPAPDRSVFRRLSWALFLAGLAGTISNTSVTVVTSGIASTFDLRVTVAAVVAISINLSMAFFMPVAGWVSGRIGPRRVLLGSAVILVVSSIVLTVSNGILPLLMGRIGQGVALGGVTPTAVQAATLVLADRERGRAIGWWSAANGIGLAVGPVAGGLLFAHGGWRIVPLPAVAIGVLLFAVSLQVPKGIRGEASVALDSVMLIGGTAAVMLMFTSAVSTGATNTARVLAFALAVVVAIAVVRTNRVGPLVPPSWVRRARVRRPALSGGLQMFVNGMCQVAVPVWLVSSIGLDQGAAGVALIAMTGTMALAAPFVGRRVDVPFETWVVIGFATVAVGLTAASAAMAQEVWTWLIPSLVVIGAGSACLLTTSFHAFSRTEAGSEGVGLAIYNVMRLGAFALGGLAGVAAIEAGASGVSFIAAAALCVAFAMAVKVRRDPVDAAPVAA